MKKMQEMSEQSRGISKHKIRYSELPSHQLANNHEKHEPRASLHILQLFRRKRQTSCHQTSIQYLEHAQGSMATGPSLLRHLSLSVLGNETVSSCSSRLHTQCLQNPFAVFLSKSLKIYMCEHRQPPRLITHLSLTQGTPLTDTQVLPLGFCFFSYILQGAGCNRRLGWVMRQALLSGWLAHLLKECQAVG